MSNVKSGSELRTEPVETRVARVYRDESGIVVITMKDCGEMDEGDIADLNLVIRHTAGHMPSLKLVIAIVQPALTKKARAMAKNENNLTPTLARAIVVSNFLKASVLNFMRRFNKRSYPQQFFANKETACDWLLSHKK